MHALLFNCVWLCDPTDCSPPGSSVHGIFQARTLEWLAISSSRKPSWPRDQTGVSSCISGGFFTSEPLGSLFEPHGHEFLLNVYVQIILGDFEGQKDETFCSTSGSPWLILPNVGVEALCSTFEERIENHRFWLSWHPLSEANVNVWFLKILSRSRRLQACSCFWLTLHFSPYPSKALTGTP